MLLVLAANDFSFSTLIHPMLIASLFGQDVSTFFNRTGCNWYGFGAVFFGCLSMIIHGVISIVRYHSVLNPPHLNKGANREFATAFLLIIISVFYAAIFAAGPLYGWGKFVKFEYG